MHEGGVGGQVFGALQGGDDGAEMGDDDDVGAMDGQPVKRLAMNSRTSSGITTDGSRFTIRP